MIAIIDYGMGNLRSVQKAFEHVGARAVITQDPDDLNGATSIVLPGVGAMKPAADRLAALNFVPAIQQGVADKKPFLGICLGFQLLFDSSDEGGQVAGLGLLPGTVRRFTNAVKVPHMGWNQLRFQQTHCPLFKGLENGVNVYFCHSYYAIPGEDELVASDTEYDGFFSSSVARGNIFGLQFHPEKSQKAGLTMLENFAQIERGGV